MTDYQPFSSATHPIIECVDDWNNLLDHGLEKPATFIVRVNGSYTECLVGGTSSLAGTILYGGVDNAGGVSGTDAQAVVQAAADAASVLYSGGVVWMKEGTYSFDSAVTVSAKNNVYIQGVGMGTFVTQANSSDNTHFFNWLNCTYGGLSDLQIDGNGANQAAGTTAVEINGTSNKIVVQRCAIVDMYNIGVEIGGTANHNWVVDNFFNDCTNNAVHIGYASQTAGYNTVSRNHMYENDAFGVGTVMADRNTIAENIITQNASGTLNEGINLDRSSNNRVLGNTINTTGDAGIVVHTSNNATPLSFGNLIANNEVYFCAFMGIHLHDYSQSNIVATNHCWNNNQDDDQVNKWAGIELDESTTTYNLVTGNLCRDTQGAGQTQTFGIKLHTAADYNIFRNNDCRTNLDGPYSIVAGNNTFDATVKTATAVDLSGGADTVYAFWYQRSEQGPVLHDGGDAARQRHRGGGHRDVVQRGRQSGHRRDPARPRLLDWGVTLG
jgi:parallel beta-helix repeat protein